MAPRLKRFFDRALVERIAHQLAGAEPSFPREAFLAEASAGLDRLELMDRARWIAAAMRAALPDDFERAVDVIVRALGPERQGTERPSMAPFLYLPHTLLVAEHGLDHFEPSMRAQHELTRRFTAEFSIRPFLERHPDATLARLAIWSADPSPHVRRLVSEGTRPRLPWAPRLRAFQRDPRPVLALLERLRDDPEPSVRRSVANNLNDIGKDHPGLLLEVCRRWSEGAGAGRAWIVRHALRWRVKAGDRGALTLLGYGPADGVTVRGAVRPRRVAPGGAVLLELEVTNGAARARRVALDVAVHFVKASGAARPKVFKGAALSLPPGGRATVRKRISLAPLTTRAHHAGLHRVEALVNGAAVPIGAFVLAGR
jgi:3-methyladenine DNA glycosylase AlkC